MISEAITCIQYRIYNILFGYLHYLDWAASHISQNIKITLFYIVFLRWFLFNQSIIYYIIMKYRFKIDAMDTEMSSVKYRVSSIKCKLSSIKC